MDLYFLLSALFGTFSLLLCAGSSAPAAETHVRTKRCSCATFLDKECVYFCHLDIIWVNTPERVVSYGLGNAPRTKRSLPGPLRPLRPLRTGPLRSGPRCRCLQEDDQTCTNFCQREQHHRDESETKRSVQTQECSKSKSSPQTSSEQSRPEQVLSPKLRPAVQTRTLLEKWRPRRRNRSRTWDAQSSAS